MCWTIGDHCRPIVTDATMHPSRTFHAAHLFSEDKCLRSSCVTVVRARIICSPTDRENTAGNAAMRRGEEVTRNGWTRKRAGRCVKRRTMSEMVQKRR